MLVNSDMMTVFRVFRFDEFRALILIRGAFFLSDQCYFFTRLAAFRRALECPPALFQTAWLHSLFGFYSRLPEHSQPLESDGGTQPLIDNILGVFVLFGQNFT
jgi:hypothetical protein